MVGEKGNGARKRDFACAAVMCWRIAGNRSDGVNCAWKRRRKRAALHNKTRLFVPKCCGLGHKSEWVLRANKACLGCKEALFACKRRLVCAADVPKTA